VALVAIPPSPFYVDDQTGVIWAPDPNGTRLSPNGLYKLAPQTPASSSTNPATGETTNTYAGVTQAQAVGAYVGDPADAVAAGAAPPGSSPPPASSSSTKPPASSPSSSSPLGLWLGVPRTYWYLGAAAAAVLVLTSPPRR
jgi:hypothetical protein